MAARRQNRRAEAKRMHDGGSGWGMAEQRWRGGDAGRDDARRRPCRELERERLLGWAGRRGFCGP